LHYLAFHLEVGRGLVPPPETTVQDTSASEELAFLQGVRQWALQCWSDLALPPHRVRELAITLDREPAFANIAAFERDFDEDFNHWEGVCKAADTFAGVAPVLPECFSISSGSDHVPQTPPRDSDVFEIPVPLSPIDTMTGNIIDDAATPTFGAVLAAAAASGDGVLLASGAGHSSAGSPCGRGLNILAGAPRGTKQHTQSPKKRTHDEVDHAENPSPLAAAAELLPPMMQSVHQHPRRDPQTPPSL
jgi:hypothetical protein